VGGGIQWWGITGTAGGSRGGKKRPGVPKTETCVVSYEPTPKEKGREQKTQQKNELKMKGSRILEKNKKKRTIRKQKKAHEKATPTGKKTEGRPRKKEKLLTTKKKRRGEVRKKRFSNKKKKFRRENPGSTSQEEGGPSEKKTEKTGRSEKICTQGGPKKSPF